MKLKSFLFLIAALGLAFASCSSDTETETVTVNRGYAGDALQIALAFEEAPDVYLYGPVDLSGQFLTIPKGKTLHLNGNTVTLGDGTTLVVNGSLNYGTGGKIDAQGKKAFLVGFDPDSDTTHLVGFGSALKVETGKVTTDEGKYYTVVTTKSDLLDSGKIKDVLAGTTVIFAGNLDLSNSALDTNDGTLSVGGNLTNVTGITTTTAVTIGGKLSGGKPAAPAASYKPALAGGPLFALTADDIFMKGEGTVSAYLADISRGSIGVSLFRVGNGKFGGNSNGEIEFGGTLAAQIAVFNGPVKFTAPPASEDKATFTFNDDVEFVEESAITNVTIDDSKKLKGKLTATTFSAPGTTGFILDNAGQLIVTQNSPGNNYLATGTFAAIGTGTLTLALSPTNITVSGDGTLSLGEATSGAIVLKDTNTFVFSNDGGIYLVQGKTITGNGGEGKGGYHFGGTAGTLFSTKQVTLGANSIKGDNGSAPTITFGVANAAGGSFLTIFAGSTAIIENANIDIKGGGSISVGEGKGSASIILGSGGSITARNLAWGGTIAGTASGGSLLVGSLSVEDGGSLASNVEAGSVGTSSNIDLILPNADFLRTTATLQQGLTGVVKNNDGGSASTGGSILIFSAPSAE